MLTAEEKKEILNLLLVGKNTILSELVDNPHGYSLREMLELNFHIRSLIKKIKENI